MTPVIRQRDPRFVLFGLGVDQTSWRGVGLLAAVFFGSLGIAAVLTPPAYWLVQLWHDRTGSANAQWLLDKGVDVYFDRLRMASIVLGLPWLMSKCHLWSWRAIGLSFDRAGWNMMAKGWWSGLILVVLLAWFQIAATDVVVRPGVAWVRLAINSVLAGIALGFVEEVIFRGLILRIFHTATKLPWLAIGLTSAFFAYTHFKVPSSVWTHVAPGVHWDTGFFVAFWTTIGITENFNATQFLGLWLLGMVLGMLTLRTGTLMANIGLHAGLVAAMIFYRGACGFYPGHDRSFWGGSGLTDGWVTSIILGAILVMVVFARPERRPTSNA